MLGLPNEYKVFSETLEKVAIPTNDLFHYTNSAGLKGVLTTQQIWLTDYRHLPGEINYALSVVKKIILENFPKGKIHFFWQDLFDDIDSHIGPTFHFFIASFCMKCDYPYVWQHYGDKGKGFAIVFKKEFFTGGQFAQSNAPIFGRGKVFYNFSELKQTILDLAFMVQNKVMHFFSNSKYSVESRVKIAKYFCVTLLPFLTAIKEITYEQEHERRIYALMGADKNHQKFFTHGEDEDGKSISVPRVYFSFDLQHISEIWIGPQQNYDDALLELKSIFDSLYEKGVRTNQIRILKSNVSDKKNLTATEFL